MGSLSDELLRDLVADLDNEQVVGITLGGSYARGEAGPFSDVDLAVFFREGVKPPRKRFFYRNGLLISVKMTSVAEIRAMIAHPASALLFVKGGRRILLDKDGSVTRLWQDIEDFDWEPFQSIANEQASFELMLCAEQAHKVLNELHRNEELALAYTTIHTVSWLTRIIALQGGVLVKSDHTYYQQVQQAVGLDSHWTYYHRILVGINDPLPGAAHVRVKAMLVLSLYRETLAILRPTMQPAHREVVEHTVQIIEQALLRLNNGEVEV